MWFIGSAFFPFNSGFYHSLNLPVYTPPGIVFSITWIVLYLFITLSIFIILKEDKFNNDYLFILIINYLFNQLFSLFFFSFNNLFLTLISVIVTFISSLFLYLETKKLNNKSAYLLIPYLAWNLFALVLYINIYLIN
jgi:tryptophan-rich sensory protein